MANPRPSLTILMDLDERLATDETRQEIMRGFNYCGTCLVRTHEAAEHDDVMQSNVRFLVKMGNHKYLYSADENADTLWNEVMERWLRSQFNNFSNNMQIFNRRQREIGNTELDFTWLQIELENGRLDVNLRQDSTGAVSDGATEAITTMRTALNNGVLGDDVVVIAAPSDASYAAQAEAGLVAKAQREAEEEAAKAALEAEKAAEEQAAVDLANETFIEAPDLVEPEVDEDVAFRESLEERFKMPPADFPLCYDVWTISYADGTTRDFDSATGQFV